MRTRLILLCTALGMFWASSTAYAQGKPFAIRSSKPTSLSFSQSEPGASFLDNAGEATEITLEGLLDKGAVAYKVNERGEPTEPVPVTAAEQGIRIAAQAGSRYVLGSESVILAPKVSVNADGQTIGGSERRQVKVSCKNFQPRPIEMSIDLTLPPSLRAEPSPRQSLSVAAKGEAVAAFAIAFAPSAKPRVGRQSHEIRLTATCQGRAVSLKPIVLTSLDEPMTTGIRVEAEQFAGQGGGEVTISTEKVAASHKAFLNWNKSGHWLEWTINVPKDGRFQLAVRYCTQFESATRDVLVDGAQPFPDMKQVTFPGTGGWANKANDWNHLVL
ncbi:MAG: carbohydrate-binding protein, partial [Planctomycetes bacterium]|nr:carbohydrate-binding protein [Planctomycetota bacterium]